MGMEVVAKNPITMPPKTCQEIVKLTRQQCRNACYCVTELPANASPTEEKYDLFLCRLHFSFKLNDPEFRTYPTWPLNQEDVSNMQLLYDLHDRSKP